MPIPANAVVSVLYRTTWNLQRMMLYTTWKVESTTSTDTLITDLNAINLHFGTAGAGTPRNAYLACISQDTVLDYVQSQQISGIRSVYRQRAITANGAWAADASTGNVAAVVTLKTNNAGRDQVANKHIGPLGSDAYAGGAPVAGLTVALNTLAAELISAQAVAAVGGGTITLVPCIWHAKFGSNDLITTSGVSLRIGTMRRRTVGQGE